MDEATPARRAPALEQVAVPGQEGHRRPGRPARADGRRPAGPRPPAGRGRARAGQDAGDQDARRRHRRPSSSASSSRPTWCPPTSSAPASTTRSEGEFQVVARPGLRQPGARRRDQPGPGQGAERPAGGHAGAPGHDRPGDPPRARPVPRHGHPEPHRVRGHLPAARGPGRPVHAQGARRLPDRHRGVRHRRADDRRSRDGAGRSWTPSSPASGSSRRPTPCTSTRRSSSTPSGWHRDARPRRGRPGRPRPVRHLRGQPAGVDQHGARRPRRWRSSAAASTRCPRTCRDLARDVLRHRWCSPTRRSPTTSSAEDMLDPILRGGPAARGRRCRRAAVRSAAGQRHRGAHDRPTLTPERVLRRLEWRVIRRLDGRLQGDYRTLLPRARHRLPRPARVRVGRRRAPHRLERHRADGRAVRPGVRRGPRGHRLAAARPLRVDGLRPRRAAEGAGPAPRSRRRWRSCSSGAATGSARCSSTRRRETIPPGQGRNQVLRIARELLKRTGPPATAPAGRHRPRRCCSGPRSASSAAASLVVIVSDFISQPAGSSRCRRLARRHEVVAVQLVDRREFELPTPG